MDDTDDTATTGGPVAAMLGERNPFGTMERLEHGALVEPLAVGVHGVRWARMQPGATVVILGAGTIGLTSLMAARALGAGAVHITARHPHQAALARALSIMRRMWAT